MRTSSISLVLPAALLTPLAHAATLNVGGTGGYASVQAAINASTSGDTINVRAGTFTGPIDTRGKSLTIRGAGVASTTLQASTAGSTLITISRGERVTISDLKLTGAGQGIEVRGSTLSASDLLITGMSGGGAGAGIELSAAANATLTRVELRSNAAGTGWDGGAIFVEDSTLDVVDGVWSQNRGDSGGALYAARATLRLDGLRVEENTAVDQGGGLFVSAGTVLTATDTTLDTNQAAGRGGGIAATDSDIEWTGGAWTANTSGAAGGGGSLSGQATAGSRLWLDIADNSADGDGGGLYATDLLLELSDSELADNTSGARGGGLWTLDADLTLTRTALRRNTAVDDGGGAQLRRTAGGPAALAIDLILDGNSASAGGGVDTEVPLTIRGLSGGANEALAGDGGALRSASTLVLTRAALASDIATGTGGAIALRNGSLSVSDSSISDAAAGDGGCIAAFGSGTQRHSLTNIALAGCTATGSGGALRVDAAATLTAAGLSLLGSDAGFEGGGAALSDIGSLDWQGGEIRANVAPTAAGVAISGSAGLLRTLDVAANIASRSAGGLMLRALSGALTVSTSALWENAAPDAGGLWTDPGGAAVSLTQLSIVANDGDGLHAAGRGVTVHNTVLEGNSGAGLRADVETPTSYSQAGGNSAAWAGPAGAGSGAGSGNGTRTCAWAAVIANGDPEDDVLLFGAPSPCRDQGDPALTDLDGSRSDPGHRGGAFAVDGDADGDGVARSAGDCADADPTAYPGAAERWYDGVDQDCAGGDDNDADLDGSPIPEDCDDLDPTVHPGAEDASTDGIDQDCDGSDGVAGTDGTDGADGDEGTDGADAGDGTDGTDTWPEAQDADGDGVPQSADCNDADPDIRPEATEACGNGADDDCDGFVDDYDADCMKSGGGCAVGARAPGALWLAISVWAWSGRRRRR